MPIITYHKLVYYQAPVYMYADIARDRIENWGAVTVYGG